MIAFFFLLNSVSSFEIVFYYWQENILTGSNTAAVKDVKKDMKKDKEEFTDKGEKTAAGENIKVPNQTTQILERESARRV